MTLSPKPASAVLPTKPALLEGMGLAPADSLVPFDLPVIAPAIVGQFVEDPDAPVVIGRPRGSFTGAQAVAKAYQLVTARMLGQLGNLVLEREAMEVEGARNHDPALAFDTRALEGSRLSTADLLHVLKRIESSAGRKHLQGQVTSMLRLTDSHEANILTDQFLRDVRKVVVEHRPGESLSPAQVHIQGLVSEVIGAESLPPFIEPEELLKLFSKFRSKTNRIDADAEVFTMLENTLAELRN